MADGALRVSVIYSPAPREVVEWPLTLGQGATVMQALDASGLKALAPELDLNRASVGIWGRQARLEQVLRDGDRIEVLRPLQVDPKVARRERFRKQGSRGAGLFARKKAGAGGESAGQ
jgi:uncharacterized protein